MPREMERVAALAKGMPGIKAVPRFVLALHVGCRGPGEKPDTLKLRLLACLWDLEAGKAHTIVQRIEEARAADVLARMSCIPAEAALLAARHAAPAKEADPSKPLKTPWKMQVEARKGATPIDLAKEKVLLLPCGPWGFAGAVDEAATGAALLAGTVSFFGESGISLAPMGPVFEAAGLNAMSYRLCYGAYHVADFHEQFTLDDGCGVGIEEVPVMVNKAVGLAVEKLALPGPFPDYLFGLAVVSLGEQKPGVLKYRVIACVYDLVSKQVHTVAWASRETAKDAMLAEMAVLPGEVFEQLGEVAFKRP